MTRVLILLSALIMGCQAGPTFKDIESIKIQRVGSGGLAQVALNAAAQRRAVDCLYKTQEVSAEASANEMLLQEVYLIEVHDSNGIRSFELYTGRHLKGNRGRYYQNDCLKAIIDA